MHRLARIFDVEMQNSTIANMPMWLKHGVVVHTAFKRIPRIMIRRDTKKNRIWHYVIEMNPYQDWLAEESINFLLELKTHSGRRSRPAST